MAGNRDMKRIARVSDRLIVCILGRMVSRTGFGHIAHVLAAAEGADARLPPPAVARHAAVPGLAAREGAALATHVRYDVLLQLSRRSGLGLG